jgi:hypothetical protein
MLVQFIEKYSDNILISKLSLNSLTLLSSCSKELWLKLREKCLKLTSTLRIYIFDRRDEEFVSMNGPGCEKFIHFYKKIIDNSYVTKKHIYSPYLQKYLVHPDIYEPERFAEEIFSIANYEYMYMRDKTFHCKFYEEIYIFQLLLEEFLSQYGLTFDNILREHSFGYYSPDKSYMYTNDDLY